MQTKRLVLQSQASRHVTARLTFFFHCGDALPSYQRSQISEAKAAAALAAKAAAELQSIYGFTMQLLERLDLKQHFPQFL